MRNVALTILESAAARPTAVALRHERDGRWIDITYGDMAARIDRLAAALVAEGVEAGDRVGIISPNLPEWIITDYAAMSIRAATVPIYPTSTVEQATLIVENSGLAVLFAGTADEVAIARKVADACPHVRRIVAMAADAPAGDARCRTQADLEAADAGDAARAEVERRRADAAPDDLAAVIYTSGTTGEPKGVMLRHRNFANQFTTVSSRFKVGPEDRSLCFLPLSHVYERTWSAFVLQTGASNTILANPRQVVTAIGEARPTVMVSAPRLYERVHAAVLGRVETGPPLRRKLFHWAIGVGDRWWRTRQAGQAPGLGLKLSHALADRLVLVKIRNAVGGPKNFFSSGGAALAREVEEFFMAAGLLVCQGYGLTETAPMLTCNAPGAFKFGTVGLPVDGVELRISPEGEIQARGPNVTEGYFRNPEATSEAFDDGWFKTGDIGHIDQDGYVVITDRMKDLIITAGGKNVAPQRVEAIVGKDLYVDQLAVIGDDRSSIAALVVPNFETLGAWAKDHGLAWSSNEELVALPDVVELYRARIAHHGRDLASFEKIRRFKLLVRPFSPDAGEITPTLKVRRKVIMANYADLIDRMYEEPVVFDPEG